MTTTPRVNTPWEAPRLWAGSTCYIIGGGHSVLDTDLSLIHDKRVIGVNDAFLLGPWVDACWFGDSRWHHWNAEALRAFSGLKATCFNLEKKPIMPAVKWMKRGKGYGIDKAPGRVAWNQNSGLSAINFAYHLGVERIVLIGFDMKFGPKGEDNYHKNHKKRGREKDPFPRFLRAAKKVKEDAEEIGLEILNATPDSAMEEFPRVRLEEVVCQKDRSK